MRRHTGGLSGAIVRHYRELHVVYPFVVQQYPEQPTVLPIVIQLSLEPYVVYPFVGRQYLKQPTVWPIVVRHYRERAIEIFSGSSTNRQFS